jgi:lipoprotein-anchoring transpeptidase ErfK/SrfK
MRQRVLAQADAASLRRGSSSGAGWRRYAIIAAALVPVLGYAGYHTSKLPEPTQRPQTRVEIEQEDNAVWSRRSDERTEHIALSQGALNVQVYQADNGKHVLMHVPDGEIEDIGTVFRVHVREGQTQKVSVREGRVVLRLNNAPAITLGAGESWTKTPETTVRTPAEAIGTSAPSSAVAASALVNNAPMPSLHVAPRASVGTATALPAAQNEDEHRGEDAAYLAVTRLLREGREAEAKVLAREYLRLYPNGFRREELARLVH